MSQQEATSLAISYIERSPKLGGLANTNLSQNMIPYTKYLDNHMAYMQPLEIDTE